MDDLVKRLRESGSRSEVELHEDREDAVGRIEELEAKLAKVEDDVLISVSEALAGMSHEHASPYTRFKIGEAIDRVFTGL